MSDRSSAAAPDDVHSDEGSGIDEPDVGGGGSEEEEGDEYDEPPVEAADRSSKVTTVHLYLLTAYRSFPYRIN